MTEQSPSGSKIEGLREKALAATQGEWQICTDYPAISIGLGRGGHSIVQTPNQNNYQRFGPANRWDGVSSDANAAYIAAAQPSTVLALIDRIEALEAALRPFANWPMERGRRDDEIYLGSTVSNVTYHDFEIARTTLSGDTK